MAIKTGMIFEVGKVSYFYNAATDIKTLYGSPTSKEMAYTNAYTASKTLGLSDSKAVSAGMAAKNAYLKAELYNKSTAVTQLKATQLNPVTESYNAAFYAISQLGLYSVLDPKGANLVGTDFNDFIVGLNGNDNITSGKGNDYIYAGNGANTISGGDGDDTIIARTGPYTSEIIDKIPQTDRPYHKSGIALSQVKRGNYTGDVVYTGTGRDLVDTGIGNDLIYLGSGNKQVLSGSGGDTIKFDKDNYDISNTQQLALRKTEKSVIRMETGDDIIDLGDTVGAIKQDSEELYGIDLGDIYYTIKDNSTKLFYGDKKDADGNPITDASGKVIKEYQLFPESYIYDYVYKGKLTVYMGSGHDLIKTGAGADIIYSSSGNDTISSGAGADFIDAGYGDDVVITGAGSDTVNLGSGADMIYVSFGDTINFTARDGQRDTIKVDPLILDYEEGIIVESQFLPVKTTINGKETIAIEQVPVKRLGKIVIKYPESKSSINTDANFAKNKDAYVDYLKNIVGLSDIDSNSSNIDYSQYLNRGSSEYQKFLDLNPIYDQIDLSELFEQKGINTYNIDIPLDGSKLDLTNLSLADKGDYIKYGYSYITVQDLNNNLKKVSNTATDISQLTEVSLRKLMNVLSDKNMLQQTKGEVMLNIPIPNGAIVDVIEVHIIGATLAEVGQMLII